MKLIMLVLILFSMSMSSQQQYKSDVSDFYNTRMISVMLDWSRLAEDPEEMDSGVDVVITLVPWRDTTFEPIIKFEWFPSLDFTKLAIGYNYTYDIGLTKRKEFIELALGVEIALITRKNPGKKSKSSWASYGFNAEFRLLWPFRRIPFIISNNYQWRSDEQVWNADPKWVYSLYGGFGVTF